MPFGDDIANLIVPDQSEPNPLDWLRAKLGPSWLDRATAEVQRQTGILNAGGGLADMLADTSETQDLASGFGGTTKAVRAPRVPIPKYFSEPFDPNKVNLGKSGQVMPGIQTVADPYRTMYPGIYRNPKEIAEIAASHLVPEDPAMKQLWGVTRGDLDEIVKDRIGNRQDPGVILAKNPSGSVAAQNIMTPQNTQRLIDILGEAGKVPGLAHTDAWYVMDPMYQRMVQLFGPEEALARYRHLNTMTGMASPSSDVMREIMRGTTAHWLEAQGRFKDFAKWAHIAKEDRPRSFPADLAYMEPHPYAGTSVVKPMEKYLARGRVLESENPKVPLYVGASGVPQTGFQTASPVGDAHWSRGVGLADTRKGPTDVGASFSRPELQTVQPWWESDVAHAVGLQPVSAQSRLWTVLGPQTGVESALGAGKLELFSQQIKQAAYRLGISPEKARDLILSGGAGAGVLAGAVPMIRQDEPWPALTDHLQGGL